MIASNFKIYANHNFSLWRLHYEHTWKQTNKKGSSLLLWSQSKYDLGHFTALATLSRWMTRLNIFFSLSRWIWRSNQRCCWRCVDLNHLNPSEISTPQYQTTKTIISGVGMTFAIKEMSAKYKTCVLTFCDVQQTMMFSFKSECDYH